MRFWRKKGPNRLTSPQTAEAATGDAVGLDAVELLAPAKLNLTLHVTGRRADGYHLLNSLVAFADVGDRLRLSRAAATTLSVAGPRAAGVPTGPENLILRAAALIPDARAEIVLHKALPAAAGVGGGSADAAATLRGLAALGGQMPAPSAILGLGADVPVCLEGRACRMAGVGEALSAVAPLPSAWVVLANPGIALHTARVFAGLAGATGAPMPDLPRWASLKEFAAWLAGQRNDLQAPAIAAAPVVADVIDALGQSEGCRLARMSGSGATCFGLYASAAAAGRAVRTLEGRGWWIVAAPLRTAPPPVQAIRATT